MCVCLCLCYPGTVFVFEGVMAWLTDWPTEAGRDERKVREMSGRAEKHTHKHTLHGVHLNPVTEYGSEILAVLMSMK